MFLLNFRFPVDKVEKTKWEECVSKAILLPHSKIRFAVTEFQENKLEEIIAKANLFSMPFSTLRRCE